MRLLFVSLLIVFVSAGCNSNKKNETATTDVIKTETTVKITQEGVTTYEGILPCADCSGIETTLKIHTGNNTYELIHKYMDSEPNNVFTDKGKYEIKKGLDEDPDASIYILNPDNPDLDRTYYGFYSKDPNTLYLLDDTMNRIKTELNYTLRKI